ncbi:hypothetical protein J1N35_020655 [Gossypium stocksii]|uniref:Uncharacterized protein n=1 Tax=Gossypium stocksii TaxID=47602 RepID=A0A9D3VED3_9ROSI|nr:hypothetical protein J1N35_020655 [Gossypium stocksii]
MVASKQRQLVTAMICHSIYIGLEMKFFGVSGFRKFNSLREASADCRNYERNKDGSYSGSLISFATGKWSFCNRKDET